MKESEDKEQDQEAFEYRLKEVSDEEIISILRYREHFQKQARQAAIKEAIKREIIKTTDDLNDEMFEPRPLPPRSLFPLGTTDAQTFAIFRSLCRIFYGVALLPLLFAVYQISYQEYLKAAAGFIISGIVFFLVRKLEKTIEPFISQLLLALNVPAIGYAIYYLSGLGAANTMDTVAVAIVILILLYITFYLNKLTSHFQDQKKEKLE